MQITGLPTAGGSYSLAGNITYKPIVDESINLPGGTHTFNTSREYGLQKYGIRALLAAIIIALLLFIGLLALVVRLYSRRRKKKGGNISTDY